MLHKAISRGSVQGSRHQTDGYKRSRRLAQGLKRCHEASCGVCKQHKLIKCHMKLSQGPKRRCSSNTRLKVLASAVSWRWIRHQSLCSSLACLICWMRRSLLLICEAEAWCMHFRFWDVPWLGWSRIDNPLSTLLKSSIVQTPLKCVCTSSH